ncbi:MAG: hypothetical protein RJA22_2798 [Verrucomicrobiota bacterium]|jgi:sialate O-acetylesterase
MVRAMKPWVPCLALCLAALAVRAEVRLHPLFSDHAVLQRDRPLPVWGWADPGEAVSVTLGPASGTATADAQGRWRVTLPAQPANAQPQVLRAAGRNVVEVRDVLLGDVWLCGGQSNMEMSLGSCQAPEDIRDADLPLVRHFGVGYHFAAAPQETVKGEWRVCSSRTAAGFSAVGFYFARRIHQRTKVPIGLLRSCVGGTNIELWMSQDTLLGTPELAPYARQMRESLDRYQRDLAAALPSIEDWATRGRAAVRAGQAIPLPPSWPDYPFGEKVARPRCVTLHHGMVAPLVPFALRGALWYQGENNADGHLYVEKKRAMVADWRRWFGDERMPFYFVQLAAWQKPDDKPAGGGWGPIRDAQRRCLAIPHTGMASAVDLGDAEDIHPRNKADVGERLALWALARDYGVKVEPSGPLFRELQVEGALARLRFDHVGQGLMAGRKEGREPVRETAGAPLRRFAIAGPDRQWRWADARIEGDSVVCTHPEVPMPVAVRYAYSSNPEGANLYNRDGLPASPFRTDNW